MWYVYVRCVYVVCGMWYVVMWYVVCICALRVCGMWYVVCRNRITGDIAKHLMKHKSLDAGIRSYISAADYTKDNCLTFEEIRDYSLASGSAVHENQVKWFMAEADTNSNRSLTFDEIKASTD